MAAPLPGDPQASALPPSPPTVGPPDTPLDPTPVEPVPPREARGRAGRDLRKAIAVGVVLAAVVLLTLYVQKVAFVALAAVAVVLGVQELAHALRTAEVRVPVVPVAAGGVGMLVAAYAGGAGPLAAGLGLTALAVLLWRLRAGTAGYVRDVSAGIFAAAYVPLLAGFAMLALREPDGPNRIVTLVLLTVCSDVGGYATGVLWGRRRLAPSVSPGKSWEGLGGSLAVAAVGGSLAVPLLLGGPVAAGVLVGLAVAATATLGDLVESAIKRDLRVKDMGALLPGHGGVLDRLDSLLPVALVSYLLLAWLAPAS